MAFVITIPFLFVYNCVNLMLYNKMCKSTSFNLAIKNWHFFKFIRGKMLWNVLICGFFA